MPRVTSAERANPWESSIAPDAGIPAAATGCSERKARTVRVNVPNTRGCAAAPGSSRKPRSGEQ